MQNLSMTRQPQLFRCLLVVTLLVLPLLTAANLPAQERPIEMKITAADTAAATAFATNMRYHLFPARTAAGKAVALDSPGATFNSPKHPFGAPIASLPSFPVGTGFYPEHVSKVSPTGATIVTTKSHPIFVNMASCGGSVALCWGNPALFLGDLGANVSTSMIHLVDQYVGSTAGGRYTVGAATNVTIPIFAGTTGVPTLGENDVLTMVHNAAKILGTGYGHVYHVFLPKGVDHCFDGGPCYSPSGAAPFAFCAYHFTVHFTDLAANVYYTVEPYQNVGGCQVPTGTPNGQQTDSTDNTLSHELFETITDPDIFTGFRAQNELFFEIADICQAFIFPVTLNTRKYAIQAEYSNKYEACATTP